MEISKWKLQGKIVSTIVRFPLMRVARLIALDPEQKQALEQWARARSLPKRLVERALAEPVP